jgi:pimeloyl-ACP methyl ester carboxylesterase
VLSDLCAGSECAGISANPTADLAARVRALAHRPLQGLLTSARGIHERVEIVRSDLFDVMLAGDLNPTLRAELPGALTSARRGDSAPLIRLVARSAGVISFADQASGSDFSDAVFAATLCEEGNFPWNRAANVSGRAQQINAAAQAAGERAFSPFDSSTALSTEMISLCLGWPTATPAVTPPGPLPDVPTLVIDGSADVRTPLEDAATIKTLIPSAQLLAVPYTGHSALASDLSPDGCALRAVRQFFSSEAVTPCAATGNPFSPTPVAPTSFARLKPTGRGGKIGRTITAALATAQDMRRQVIGDALEAGRLPGRAGGLRGGWVVVHGETLSLFNVVYVPGVRVSGSVPLNSLGPERLTVTGSKAAKGRIVITASSIVGHLGGRAIAITASAASTATDVAQPSLQRLLRAFRLRHAG